MQPYRLRYWSATALENLFTCPRKFYFEKMLKKRVTSPHLAKGTFVHRKISQFRLKQNKTAEAWANTCANHWIRYPGAAGKIRGDTILWSSDEEKYILKNDIHEICETHYHRLKEENPILFPTQNKKRTTAYPFKFVFNGRGFRGEIDEIHPGWNLRDYKTGSWWYLERKLEFALQPTYYTLAFCVLANKEEKMREVLGISEQDAVSWGGNPDFIDERVKFHYFMLEKAREKQGAEWVKVDRDPVIPVKRNNFQYKELCMMVDLANVITNWIEEQQIYIPFRGKHCDWCFYREECAKMTEESDVGRRQMMLFDYINQMKMLDPQHHEEEIIQLQFDFKKKFINLEHEIEAHHD